MTVYLDTSNLLKLFVAQEGFEEVRQLVESASDLETSVVAYPEARAAFARMRHRSEVPAQDIDAAKVAFERLWREFDARRVDDDLAREAGELAERYRLTGCDSLHLACYARVLRACAPRPVTFSSSDVKLSRAAQAYASRFAGARAPWLEAVARN